MFISLNRELVSMIPKFQNFAGIKSPKLFGFAIAFAEIDFHEIGRNSQNWWNLILVKINFLKVMFSWKSQFCYYNSGRIFVHACVLCNFGLNIAVWSYGWQVEVDNSHKTFSIFFQFLNDITPHRNLLARFELKSNFGNNSNLTLLTLEF